MKISKLISVLALSLGMVRLSSGQLYIAGSTTMRGIFYDTMAASNSVFVGTPQITTYVGSSPRSSIYMAFTGAVIGEGSQTIICTWTGSDAAIEAVSQYNEGIIPFLDSSAIDGTNHGTAKPSLTEILRPPDIILSDNVQAFSRNTSPEISYVRKVAVVTYEWVRNNGVWTGTNVSDAQIFDALTGYAPIGVFTGNITNDESSFVYVSGRDDLSGARVNALGLTGFGIFGDPNQIELDTNGNMIDLSGNGSGMYEGDYGYTDPGDLAGVLGISTSGKADPINGGTGFSVISYLGYDYAITAASNGATILSYDGVSLSTNNVIEGAYNFWGNEYLFEGNQSLDVGHQLLNLLLTNIQSHCTSPAAIPLSVMRCERSGPLAPPFHD